MPVEPPLGQASNGVQQPLQVAYSTIAPPLAPAEPDLHRNPTPTRRSQPVLTSQQQYGALSSTQTVQSVVIALIAGGVLSLAIFAVVWRRARHRRLVLSVRRARDSIDDDSLGGGLRGANSRRRRKRGLGKEPSLWEVKIGWEGEAGEAAIAQRDADGARAETEADEEQETKDWLQPVGVSLPPRPAADQSGADTQPGGVLVTVLIAMPDPTVPLCEAGRPVSSASDPSYDPKAEPPPAFVYRSTRIAEDDDLPPLELGTMRIAVNGSGDLSALREASA